MDMSKVYYRKSYMSVLKIGDASCPRLVIFVRILDDNNKGNRNEISVKKERDIRVKEHLENCYRGSQTGPSLANRDETS